MVSEQDRLMLERYAGRQDLIDDDEFWRDVCTVYQGVDLVLPIEPNQYTVRELLDGVDCSACDGNCCKRYRQVEITARDIERVEEGAGIRIVPKVREDGTMHLDIEDGCQFLKEGLCSVYKHRPDGCYFHPMQWGHNFEERGDWRDKGLWIRVECPQAVQSIRAIVRRILKHNPDLILLPTLALRTKGAA